MTAVMTMSPVAGAVAMPLVAYAADYNTTEDVPVDNENHRNLAVGDNLATNTGIIHENNGTIEVNMPGASVEENNNVVEDNYGDVDNSNTGRVETNHVGGQVHDGNVTDNYGTADSSVNVENNYAGATVSGNDNIVTNNWGTVTGVNQVTNNMGTVTGETVNVANNYAGGTVNNVAGTGEGPAPASGKATDPAPNPPAAPAPQVAPEPAAPAPEPEPEPEPVPELAPAIEEDTTIPATNSASIAIKNFYTAEGLALTPKLEALVATTPEQALILADAAVLDPVALSGGAALVTGSCDPATIALAKAEVLSDPAIINSLKNLRIGSQYGTPNVTGAGTVAASDGRAIKSQTVNIECAGLTSAKGVAVLVYTLNSDGTKLTRVVKPRFSKGKLRVQLPVPCEYVIVQNVGI